MNAPPEKQTPAGTGVGKNQISCDAKHKPEGEHRATRRVAEDPRLYLAGHALGAMKAWVTEPEKAGLFAQAAADCTLIALDRAPIPQSFEEVRRRLDSALAELSGRQRRLRAVGAI